MNARRFALLALLCVALPCVAAAQAKSYSVNKEGSTLSYKLKHKLHEVVGTAHPSEGKARLLPDGTLQVAVRANVKDFDSGNSNRDAHMQEVTEAAKFPLVDFKGVATGVKVPTTFPSTQQVTLKGQLFFHNVKQNVEYPLTVVFTSAKEVHTEGSFDISLEGYQVERPSLLMVKVDDKVVVEPKLTFVLEGA
ncbi:YceI family protein [Myxococcaceae bacterium JPH2]|nr:YceI family protein [Myxococcaceae bacterium JPH2]